jgi:hypothetical protein
MYSARFLPINCYLQVKAVANLCLINFILTLCTNKHICEGFDEKTEHLSIRFICTTKSVYYSEPLVLLTFFSTVGLNYLSSVEEKESRNLCGICDEDGKVALIIL